jgi:hypothetical protein
MRVTRLHTQAVFVVGLTMIAGWPHFRQPVRVVSVWRTNGPLTPRPELVAQDSRLTYAGGVPQLGSDDTTQDTAAPRYSRSGVAETRPASYARTAGGGATLVGRARTPLNQPVPYARVILRNRLTGRIEARAVADINGEFSFNNLVLSGYVVELIGGDGTVIAASEMFTGAGALHAGILRVGLNGAPRALFGTATGTMTGGGPNGGSVFLAPTASEPIGRAAAAGAGQTTQPRDSASPRT